MDRIERKVAIIGAGPAGLACARQLDAIGFDYVVVDQGRLGGALRIDYLYKDSFDEWRSSFHMAEALSRGVSPYLNAQAKDIRRIDGQWNIRTERGLVVSDYLVLATGLISRTGNYAETERVLIGPSKKAFMYPFKGRRVAIMGGGDNAFEHASIAMDHRASRVTVFARAICAQDEIVKTAISNGVEVVISKQRLFERGLYVCISGEDFDVGLVMYGFEAQLPPVAPFPFVQDVKSKRVLESLSQAERIVVAVDLLHGNKLTIESSVKSGEAAANRIAWMEGR